MCVCVWRKKKNSSTFCSPGLCLLAYCEIVKRVSETLSHLVSSVQIHLHRSTNKWINFRKLFKILWVFRSLCVCISLSQCVWVGFCVCVWKWIFVFSVERSILANTHQTKSNPILDAWLWFCFVANFEIIIAIGPTHKTNLFYLFNEEVWFRRNTSNHIYEFNIAPNDNTHT